MAGPTHQDVDAVPGQGPGSAEPRLPRVPQPILPRRARLALLGALAVLFVVLGTVQASRDTVTIDEAVDLSSGVASLVRHDLRLSPEHPPLPKVLAALPALLGHPVVPRTAAYRNGDWFDYADNFVRANDRAGRLHRVLFLARLAGLVEAVGCAALIYLLAARTIGPDAGVIAAALWLTTPLVMGFGHLVAIDLPFALATLAVALALVAMLERPSEGRAAILGLLVGLALASRHTGLVLAVIAVAATGWALRADRRRALVAGGLVAVVAVGSLWAVYRVIAPRAPDGPAGRRLAAIESSASDQSVAATVVRASPVPPEWKAGFGYLVLTSKPRPSYLFGQAWEGGRWWYFPGSILVKVPLGALGVLLAGSVSLRRLDRDRRRRILACVVLPAAALMVFTVIQPLDLGVRLLLPVLALWMVVGGAAAVGLGRRWAAAALAIVLVTQVAAVVVAAPHSLAWTPPPFEPAYRWASDSNVDLGQDLGRLERWSHGRDAYIAVSVARGLQRPAGSRALVGADPATVRGWVAVGVNDLTRVRRDQLSWLRGWCPVGSIAGSVLIYRFAEPPGPAAGPTRPVGPCTGARWSHR
ncbi:MAG: glycosyltransferase [Acidimicrobiales bacterium]|nr:glycosyltransferase [Acidimicrobiales bacterium]